MAHSAPGIIYKIYRNNCINDSGHMRYLFECHSAVLPGTEFYINIDTKSFLKFNHIFHQKINNSPNDLMIFIDILRSIVIHKLRMVTYHIISPTICSDPIYNITETLIVSSIFNNPNIKEIECYNPPYNNICTNLNHPIINPSYMILSKIQHMSLHVITPNNIVVISSMLEHNTTLQTLTLNIEISDNEFIKEHLNIALNINKTLKKLYLYGVEYSVKDIIFEDERVSLI